VGCGCATPASHERAGPDRRDGAVPAARRPLVALGFGRTGLGLPLTKALAEANRAQSSRSGAAFRRPPWSRGRVPGPPAGSRRIAWPSPSVPPPPGTAVHRIRYVDCHHACRVTAAERPVRAPKESPVRCARPADDLFYQFNRRSRARVPRDHRGRRVDGVRPLRPSRKACYASCCTTAATPGRSDLADRRRVRRETLLARHLNELMKQAFGALAVLQSSARRAGAPHGDA